MLASLRTAPALFSRPLTIARSVRRSNLRPDLIAGITVAIVSLPQAIAYALVAGLPPVMGLYAAIVIPSWPRCGFIPPGTEPAHDTLLLVLSACLRPCAQQPDYIVAAGLLAVFAGLVQLVLGVARLGMLVNFVSMPSSSGSRRRGHSDRRRGTAPSVRSDQQHHAGRHVGKPDAHLGTHLLTLAFGLSTLLIMLLIRRFKPAWPAPDQPGDPAVAVPSRTNATGARMTHCR
jgi:SulP family sulfate permease